MVVHWDQRGAGKSNPWNFEKSTMTFERFVQDAHELTEYLKERFGKERIYLLGHSWGSHLGLVLARRFPEDYWAYVGVSQHVDAACSHRVARHWLQGEIRAARDEGDLRRLERLGPPPYRDHETFVEFVRLVLPGAGGPGGEGAGRLPRVGAHALHGRAREVRPGADPREAGDVASVSIP